MPNMDDHRKTILEFLATADTASMKDLSKVVDMSMAHTRALLKKMRERGEIDSRGNTRATVYFLKK